MGSLVHRNGKLFVESKLLLIFYHLAIELFNSSLFVVKTDQNGKHRRRKNSWVHNHLTNQQLIWFVRSFSENDTWSEHVFRSCVVTNLT